MDELITTALKELEPELPRAKKTPASLLEDSEVNRQLIKIMQQAVN
jgi:hypothetical protein